MKLPKLKAVSFSILVVAASVETGTVPACPAPLFSCEGCVGGPNSTATSSVGGQFVKVSTSTLDGACFPNPTLCYAAPCEVLVSREWGGLTPGSSIDFCFTDVSTGITSCQNPPPSTGGSGGGIDNTTGFTRCGREQQFSVQWHGLFATALTSCSACTGP